MNIGKHLGMFDGERWALKYLVVDNGQVRSPLQGTEWIDKKLVAVCCKKHTTFSFHNGLGIHAYKLDAKLERTPKGVLSLVRLYGQINECEHGYTASHAEYVTSGRLEKLLYLAEHRRVSHIWALSSAGERFPDTEELDSGTLPYREGRNENETRNTDRELVGI